MQPFNLENLFTRLRVNSRINSDYEFLKDYDKNCNSVFDEDEVKKIKKDLGRFDKVDGKKGSFSQADLMEFCKSVGSQIQPIQEKIAQASEWIQVTISGINNSLIDLKEHKLNDEELKIAKDLLLSDEEGRFFVDDLASLVRDITPETLDKIKSLMAMKFGEEEEILAGGTIVQLLKLNEEDYNKAFEIFNSGQVEPSRFLGVAKLVPVLEHLPENFFQEYPDYWVKRCLDGVGFKESTDSEITYLYNDSGLLEVRNGDNESETETIINLKTKTVQTVNNKELGGYMTPFSETIKEYDSLEYDMKTGEVKVGNLLKTTVTTPSSVAGIPFVTAEDVSGNKTPLQYALVNEDGSVFVRKDFISPSGARSEYTYEETADNMKIINYRITDKDGNILLNREQTLQQIDENNFITSVNGNAYHATFEGDKLTITDKKNNITKNFSLDKKFISEGKDYVVEVLKEVPVNYLMVMDKLPIKGISFDENSDDSLHRNNGVWSREERIIGLGYQEDIAEDLALKNEKSIEHLTALFLHEYGHYLDSNPDDGNCTEISGDKEIQAVFEKELEMFIKSTNGRQQGFVDYFINGSGLGRDRGAQERVAEGTMFSNGNPIDNFAFRVMYYKMYFPETIALTLRKTDERVASLAR